MTFPTSLPGPLVYRPPRGESAHAVQTLFASGDVVVAITGVVSRPVIDAVWAAVSRERSTLEVVVQSIPVRGAHSVDSFVVVAREDGPENENARVTVVVRGDAVADVYSAAGRRRFDSQGLSPWHLASFAPVLAVGLARFAGGASGIEASGSDAPTVSDSELPLGAGVVRAVDAMWVFDESAVAVVAEPFVEQEDTLATDSDDEPQRRRARHGRSTGAGEADDDLGPDPLQPEAAPQRRSPRRSRVRIGSSAPFELYVPVYIGRRPRGPRQLSSDQVVLIEVPSPTREVSASHLEIIQRGNEVVVTDLRSTNGTAVTLPGAPRIKLRQGDSIVVPPYSRIDIGDGNVIEILPGAD